MKTLILILACLLALAAAPVSRPVSAPDEQAYNTEITQRAEKHVAALNLGDAEKAARVRTLIVQQYRGLREIDALADQVRRAQGDEAAKSAAREARQERHRMFLEALARELTPEQIETIKDKMVYNKVQVTAKGYEEIYGPLTAEQQAKVLEMLKAAREEAMDGGSSGEKDAIFKRYKGKINNYLSSQGIDMKAREKQWGQKQKAKTAATTRAAD
jgi:hypothetical protein